MGCVKEAAGTTDIKTLSACEFGKLWNVIQKEEK
jgi:hypothetical protein